MSEISTVAWIAPDEDRFRVRICEDRPTDAPLWSPMCWVSDAEAKLSECVTSYEKEVAGLTAELNAKDEEIERLERELQETKTIVGNQAERISDLEASHISEEVIDILRSKIKALESEILEQCRINGIGAEREAALLGKVAQQSAALKLARVALGEMQDLIDESYGVYGLHLNGDESPWSELEQGGRFERLTTLPEALAAIDALGEVK